MELGFKDAWVEHHNNGDYFNMHKWHSTGLPAWGNWDSVERFMYKSGGGVDIVVDDFRYTDVTDSNGNVISDHAAAECDFTFIKTDDFTESTGKLETVTRTGMYRFMTRFTWIFKALKLVLSDIQNLPELLEDL